MPSVIDRIRGMWDTIQAGPAVSRARFAITRDHVYDQTQLGEPFVAGNHYFQVILHEMFLANTRQWFVQYDPMSFVASSYIYNGKTESVPFVVGPSMLQNTGQIVPQGMIFTNTPVSGLHPYQGGPFTLTVILSRLLRENNADKMLRVVEGISGAVDPTASLSAYLKIADVVVDGLEAILNLQETVPVLGYRVTINPDINQAMQPTYFVLIDKDESQVDSSKFWVYQDRLYYGSGLSNSAPYRDADFLLFRIAQAKHRTDESVLPFYSLWATTKELAARPEDHYWGEAKSNFNALKRSLLSTPDLTAPDREQFIRQYFDQLKQIRHQALLESNLSARAALPQEELEMSRIAQELNDLDNL